MNQMLYSSMAFGHPKMLDRPPADALAMLAPSVKRFAENITDYELQPLVKYPGFSYKIIFFGDAAHIFLHHVDFETAFMRAIVCFGRKAHAQKAFRSLNNIYLNYITNDPEGIQFAADNAAVEPEADVWMMDLAAPEHTELDLEEADFIWIRTLLRNLAFCIVDQGAHHKEHVCSLGDPKWEYKA
jgi:hypothetical protein